jgi:hypothetical protein
MFRRIIPPSLGHIIMHLYKYVIAVLVLIIVYCIIKNVKIQKLIKRINKQLETKNQKVFWLYFQYYINVLQSISRQMGGKRTFYKTC